MVSIFRYLLLVGIILVANCSSHVHGGLVSQISRGDVVNKCVATSPVTEVFMDQLSYPVQRTCSNQNQHQNLNPNPNQNRNPNQIQNPNPNQNRNPNENQNPNPNQNPNQNQNPNNGNVPIKATNIESSTTKSTVNIGRSLLEELLRSGEVKRKSASSEIEQCKSNEKTPDQRYTELITAFNVILEEISRQKKECRVPMDIPSILNQMAPRTKTIARKRPFYQIYSKKVDSRTFSRDKMLDQSQMKLLRSIEKLDSQLTKFIDKLRQSDDYESNNDDDYLTYDDDDIEPIIITPNDFDYISDEPNLKVSGGNDIRRSKRSVKNSSSLANANRIIGALHGHEMVTEL